MYEITLSYDENGALLPFSLIDEGTSAKAAQLGINAYSTVFVNGRSAVGCAGGDSAELVREAALRGSRIDFCRLSENGGIIGLSEPELVCVLTENAPRRLAKRLVKKNKRHEKMPAFRRRRLYEKINRTLDGARFKIISAYMKAALSERMFIARFNNTEFYSRLTLKGGRVSGIEADVLLTGKGANRYVDVSDKAVRTANIALYAMACRGLTLDELYSVDAVFSVQSNRELDEKKAEAANEFFELVYGAKKDKLLFAYAAMAETLASLPLLPVNMRDMRLLRDNYVKYSALSNLALAYEKALSANSDFRRLVRKKLIKKYWTINDRITFLARYRKVTEACEKIAAAENYDDEKLLSAFEEACCFENEVRDRAERA